MPLAALALLLAWLTFVPSAYPHHPPSVARASDPPSKVSVIKAVYPDLYKREVARTPTRWNHLRRMAASRWWRTHPLAARERLIHDLYVQANAFPPGLKSSDGSRWIPNGANYALFTVLYPGDDGICLRTISGRETGGTYDHRVGYGFRFNAPYSVPAYGLPQANKPTKMLVMGPDVFTNPVKQIRWMYGYTVKQYGSPCNAMRFHLAGGRAGATY